MNTKKMLIATFIAIALLLSACGTTRPKAGNWKGEADNNNYEISFTITADNKIVDLEFVCEWVNVYTLTANQLNIEDDGKFIAGDPFPLVHGQFTSSTEVSGLYEGQFMCGNPNRTWSAKWVKP